LSESLKVRPDQLLYGVAGRAFVSPEPELSGDHNLIAYRSQRLADEKLIIPGAIAFRRIKVGAAALNGMADQSNGFFPIRGWSVTMVEAHASKANGGNFDIPEQPRLHVSSFLCKKNASPIMSKRRLRVPIALGCLRDSGRPRS
jgi:hypothetical protein